MTRRDLCDEIALALRCGAHARRWEHATHARDCALRLLTMVCDDCAAWAARESV